MAVGVVSTSLGRKSPVKERVTPPILPWNRIKDDVRKDTEPIGNPEHPDRAPR